MSVIIGAGTTINSAQFPSGGIVSVNFGFTPSVSRLFQLGSFDPYDTITQTTRTLSVTVYGRRPDGAGGSVALDVSPSISCVDAGTVSVTINPASCVGTLLPFTDNYFVNSYSYQKDNFGYGQETWSFTTKPIISGFTGTIVMLRKIAEGNITTGGGTVPAASMGITVNEAASNDSSGTVIQGESGSVSAGAIGNFDFTRFIVATSVGGSTGKGAAVDGLKGQGSVSIPLETVFV